MRVDTNYQKIRGMRLGGTRAIVKAFERKNSLPRRAMMELIYKGYNERHACELLAIPYKTWRYVLDNHLKSLKNELKQVRRLRVTYKEEREIRRTKRRVRRLSDNVQSGEYWRLL